MRGGWSLGMSGPRLEVSPDNDVTITEPGTGKRVTFQYELPNGFVGEAVGVLEYFDHGAATYMVRRKDGRMARVPASGVNGLRRKSTAPAFMASTASSMVP